MSFKQVKKIEQCFTVSRKYKEIIKPIMRTLKLFVASTSNLLLLNCDKCHDFNKLHTKVWMRCRSTVPKQRRKRLITRTQLLEIQSKTKSYATDLPSYVKHYPLLSNITLAWTWWRVILSIFKTMDIVWTKIWLVSGELHLPTCG